MNIEEVNGLSLKTLSFMPETCQNSTSIVLFLHGLGSNAEDLISLAPIMAPELPNTLFLSIDAPELCDMAPIGYQWFSLEDRDPDKILTGVKNVKPIITKYIDEVKAKYRLESKDLALCGFSQGTMAALYAALLYPEPLAGVLGYSGALIFEPTKDKLTKLPIFLVHGEIDDVVPFASLETAKAALMQQGIDIQTISCPNLGHSIDERGLIGGVQFLQHILGYK